MNDQERMTDFICSEKKMSANYLFSQLWFPTVQDVLQAD